MNMIRRAGSSAAAAALGAVAVFAVSGCGSGTANGLEKKTGAQVAQAAAAAIEAAASVHVTGRGLGNRFDVRIQGANRAGTETLAGGQAQLIIIGAAHVTYGDIYLKAGPDVLRKVLGSSAPVQLLAGRWLKLPSGLAASLPGYAFSLTAFANEILLPAPARTVSRATLGGREVVVVRYLDGSKLYVADTGPAYPLRFDLKGTFAGWTDFTGYGADFHITAPAGAIDLSGQG